MEDENKRSAEVVPFDYQQETFDNFKNWYAGSGKEALISYATGVGKTVAAFLCIRHVVEKGGNVLWVTHTDALVSQSNSVLKGLCRFPVGLEKAGSHFGAEDRLVIASLMTLKGKRLERFAGKFRPDLIVFDEAHHSEAPTWLSIKMAYPGAKVLNLTATPYRSDISRELNLGEVIGNKSISDGIRMGRLVPATTVGTLNLDLGGIRISKDDWESKSLGALMMEEPIVDKCIELLERNIGDRKAIVFAASVAHGRMLAERLKKKYTVSEVYADVDKDDRKEIYEKARSCGTQILVNNLVLTEGFDLPEISMVAIFRPTKNAGLFIQMLGRGLRACDGKKDCLVIDAVDAKKTVGRSKGLVLPSPDDVRKESALAGKPLSPAQVFISWFRKRSEVRQYIARKALPVSRLRTPGEIFEAMFPDMDSSNSAGKEFLRSVDEALKDVATPVPEVYDKLAAAIKSGHVESFAAFLLKRGWGYYPRGEMPKTLAADERASARVECSAAARRESMSMSIIASIDPRLKNFILDIKKSASLKEQADEHYEIHETFGRKLIWTKPAGVENAGFTYIEIPSRQSGLKAPMKSYFVRDSGGRIGRFTFYGGKLTKMEFIPRGDRMFPFVPDYCRGTSWTSAAVTEAQLQYVAKALKIQPGDAKSLNLSRMSASCLLSACYSKNQLVGIEKYIKTRSLACEPELSM